MLLFAPVASLIRKQFEGRIPDRVQILPNVRNYWNTLIHTLESHKGFVDLVVFSLAGKGLASVFNVTVKLWEVTTGAALHTLKAHADRIRHSIHALTWSPDGNIVGATMSGDTGRDIQF